MNDPPLNELGNPPYPNPKPWWFRRPIQIGYGDHAKWIIHENLRRGTYDTLEAAQLAADTLNAEYEAQGDPRAQP